MITTAGSTNVSVDVYFVDDDSGTAPGEPHTGLLFSDIETGGSASYHRQGAARVDFTLITLASASAAHADGGFILLDDSNMPGLYRADVPDAAFSTGADYVVIQMVAAGANNTIMRPLLIDLTDVDLRVSGGVLPANLTQMGGVAQSATDLKDFADDGYDPTANKVNGVVLVDTVTTLTGHTVQTGDSFSRLGAPAGASVSADLLVIDNFVDGIESTLGTPTDFGSGTSTLAANLQDMADDGTAVFDRSTDSLQAIRDRGDTDWITGGAGSGLTPIDSGTLRAGGTSTQALLPTAKTFADDILNGCVINLLTGTGAGQSRVITDYTSSSDTATVDLAWITNPDATTTYEIVQGSVNLATIGQSRLSLDDFKDFVDDGYDPASNKINGVVLVDTVTTLTGHTAQTGDNFARLGAPAGVSVSADIAVIEGQTDDIGVAGAGLTAINLPNQTMDIVGNITGNLTGSVGSVTGAVGSVTGHTPQTGDSFARLGAPAGASVSADILVIDNFVDGIEITLGTPTDFGSGTSTIAANLQDMADDGTAVYDRSTDSQQAIRDRGDSSWTTGGGGSDRLLMADTTIATLASQTSFTLTAGSAEDDTYNNLTIVVQDQSTSTQNSVGVVTDYVGSTLTVTLREALSFTIATGDSVYILAESSLKTTVVDRRLDVTANGAAGIDWANIENQTTAVDLSGTDIQLVDTVTTLTGHTPQTGDSFARLGSPAGASVSADMAAVQADTDNLQTRLPNSLSSGKMDSDMTAVSGSTTAADNAEKAFETMLLGTLSGTPTTTTAVSNISITDDDQFNGAIIIFLTASDAGLVAQRTDITGCTASTNTLTFTALTVAPASGDTIIIV